MGLFNKLAPLAHNVANVAVEHKSGLAFAGGIIFQIGAIASAVEATFKAENAISISETEMDADYLVSRSKWETFRDRFLVSWKYYIPTAIAEASSIACHVVSKKEDLNKIAVLSSACALSESMLANYREATTEMVGEKKEALIQSKAHEKEVENYISKNGVESITDTGLGDQICYDPWGHGLFKCSINAIRAAVNKLNEELLDGIGQEVKLNDLYSELNLEQTKSGDLLGWITERGAARLTNESITRDVNGIPTPVYVMDFAQGREPQNLYISWR